MKSIIAKIVDSDGRIYGYRILDTVSCGIKDHAIPDITSNPYLYQSSCFDNKDGILTERYGDESRYPVIDTHGGIKHNNRIVILDASSKDYTVTDYTGRIRKVPKEVVEKCEKEKISNLGYMVELSNRFMSRQVKKNQATYREKIADLIYPHDKVKRDKLLGEFDYDPDFGRYFREAQVGISDIKRVGKEENKKERSTYQQTDIDLPEPAETVSDTVPEDIPEETIEERKAEYTLQIEKDNDRVIVSGIIPMTYTGLVVVPEGVTHIKSYAFQSSNARGIKLPDSLVYLGEGCFSDSSLISIDLPDGITALPHYFVFNSEVERVNLNKVKSVGNFCFSRSRITELDFQGEVAQFGVSAFEGCKYLREIKHKPTVVKIRSRCFLGCKSLETFDFAGVQEIEDMAFYDTGLKHIALVEPTTFIKSNTFVGPDITSVEFTEGTYKLADDCVKNTGKQPITFTMPRSVTNIGVNVMYSRDTVLCYKSSIADTAAKMAKCTIKYIDNVESQTSLMIERAELIGMSIPDLISETITNAYNKSDMEYEYEIDESKLVNLPLNPSVIQYLGIKSTYMPEGYKEQPKFKCLLEHLASTGAINGLALSSKMQALRSTFSVTHRKIYDDKVSRLYEFKFSDHKYESATGTYLIAITGNTVRYCGFNNKYTDIICRRVQSKDLKKLLSALVPGDSIGYNCVIGGKTYSEIAGDSDKPIKEGFKETFKVNIYQAIFECSIAVKLERNKLALILPANNKILKCAALGKSVWMNETEEGFKVKQCVIEDIQDIKGNTILEYGVKTPNRENDMFDKLNSLSDEGISKRIESYSYLLGTPKSPFINFRNYCIRDSIDKVEDMDINSLGCLLAFPIVEERTQEWLKKFLGKTIVAAAKSIYTLKDGTIIHQYKTVKRVAMRNKLITGGDRTIYVYDVQSANNARLKVVATTLELDELFSLGHSMVDTANISKYPKIFTDGTKFDVVPARAFIKIVPMFVSGKSTAERKNSSLWLTVYKPTGLYYISFLNNSKSSMTPLIQVGEFDVLLDYVDCSNTSTASGHTTLMNTGLAVFSPGRGYGNRVYPRMRRAHELIVNGESDVSKYIDTGLEPVLIHLMGTQQQTNELYTIPTKDDIADIKPTYQNTIEPSEEPAKPRARVKRERKPKGIEEISEQDIEELNSAIEELSLDIEPEDIETEEEFTLEDLMDDIGEGDLDEGEGDIGDDDFDDLDLSELNLDEPEARDKVAEALDAVELLIEDILSRGKEAEDEYGVSIADLLELKKNIKTGKVDPNKFSGV